MKTPNFTWDADFDEFLDSLNNSDAARLLSIIEKIEEYGLQIAQRQEWVKKLEHNLYEIRAKQLRAIYFQIIANNYFISHGFKKMTKRTPKKDITKGRNKRDHILSLLRRDHND